MTFQEWLDGLSNTEQQIIRQQLTLFSKTPAYRQFVINLYAECRLTNTGIEEIGQTLLIAGPDVDNLCQEVTRVCRKHVLAGNPIPAPWPDLYGRAITKERFSTLLRNEGLASSKTEARQFVDAIIGSPGSAAHTGLKNKYLSTPRHTVWATFNEKNPTGDPFEGVILRSAVICDTFGLSPRDRRRDVLLLVYSLPSGIEPRFPTVADAYAGNPQGWFVQFRVAPLGEPCGRVMPANAVPARPEVVHDAIKGDRLQGEIRIAKAR